MATRSTFRDAVGAGIFATAYAVVAPVVVLSTASVLGFSLSGPSAFIVLLALFFLTVILSPIAGTVLYEVIWARKDVFDGREVALFTALNVAALVFLFVLDLNSILSIAQSPVGVLAAGSPFVSTVLVVYAERRTEYV